MKRKAEDKPQALFSKDEIVVIQLIYDVRCRYSKKTKKQKIVDVINTMSAHGLVMRALYCVSSTEFVMAKRVEYISDRLVDLVLDDKESEHFERLCDCRFRF